MLIVLIWFSLFICWCSLILVVHGLSDCCGYCWYWMLACWGLDGCGCCGWVVLWILRWPGFGIAVGGVFA